MTNEEMHQVIRDVQEKCTRGTKAFKRPAFAGLDKIYIAYMKNYKENKEKTDGIKEGNPRNYSKNGK